MIDLQNLKERVDLRDLVERDLGQAPVRSGRAYLWKCPFHKERKGYSLAVWNNGYRCFGACDRSGDAVDWLMRFRDMTFTEAVSALGSPLPDKAVTKRQERSPRNEPPLWEWQKRARDIVQRAEDTLWSSAGEPALTYLIERGLTTATIRSARLGYIPGDWRETKTLFGMNVPCGITIPWFADDALWAVKVRRASGTPKYLQLAGGNAHGLYNADALMNGSAAIFCEGEFDALIVQQEAGHLVTAVTLGSAINTLSARWHFHLIGCETVLVAYDNDDAGRRGAQKLVNTSPRFHLCPLPDGKDINDFFLAGGNVYAWIEGGLP